jgi:hypothetical protein
MSVRVNSRKDEIKSWCSLYFRGVSGYNYCNTLGQKVSVSWSYFWWVTHYPGPFRVSWVAGRKSKGLQLDQRLWPFWSFVPFVGGKLSSPFDPHLVTLRNTTRWFVDGATIFGILILKPTRFFPPLTKDPNEFHQVLPRPKDEPIHPTLMIM